VAEPPPWGWFGSATHGQRKKKLKKRVSATPKGQNFLQFFYFFFFSLSLAMGGGGSATPMVDPSYFFFFLF